METALQLPEILTIVLSHLASKADLFACAHVSRLWSPLALSLVYGCAARPLKVHSTARTLQLLNNHKAQKIIQCKLLALEITRATSTLFSELPHLAPRLHTLVISSSATFPAKLLAIVLPQLECLQTFSILNHETSRRSYTSPRRQSDFPGTPGYASNNALCHLAAGRDFGATLPGLTALTLVSCPDLIDEDFLHYLSPQASGTGEGCGHALQELHLQSCHSLSPASLRALIRYAPNLQKLALIDLDIDEVPKWTDDLEQGLAAGHTSLSRLISSLPLRSLCLSSLHLKQAMSSLRIIHTRETLSTLILSNLPDFSASDLKAFTNVNHLKITSCPALRYIPVNGKEGLRELRTLSFLGSSKAYIPYQNLFALCSLGKGEVHQGSQQGQRGLRRLIIDSAETAMPVFRQASRALMYKLGAEKETFWFIELPGSAAVKTTVPYEDYEKVPETYQQHALTSVLNSHLPADALYEALAQAENLELFGLYGRAKSPHPLLSEAQKRNLFERNPNLCKLLGV